MPRHIVSRLVVTLMMRPQRCARSAGNTARVIRNAATTLTSMMRRNSSGVVSQSFPRGRPSRRSRPILVPALLSRISTRPKRSMVARRIFGPLSFQVTSATMPFRRSPPPRSSAASRVSSSAGPSSSTAATQAPASSNPSVITRPRPRPAPVTIATFPSSDPAMIRLSCRLSYFKYITGLWAGERRLDRLEPQARFGAKGLVCPDIMGISVKSLGSPPRIGRLRGIGAPPIFRALSSHLR